MRRTAHFLCNADEKGKEEGGEFNEEETRVTSMKKKCQLSLVNACSLTRKNTEKHQGAMMMSTMLIP